MSVEVEIKIRLTPSELESFRSFLDSIKSSIVCPRAAESNWLFDYSDRRLSQNGSTVRLRNYSGRSILTFKGPVIADERFKKRPEFQTTVADSEATLNILAGLGLKPTFEYHKFRELRTWALDEGILEIALDETPVGNFVELEGPPVAIDRAAGEMGWKVSRYCRESYVDLYAKAGLGSVDSSRPAGPSV